MILTYHLEHSQSLVLDLYHHPIYMRLLREECGRYDVIITSLIITDLCPLSQHEQYDLLYEGNELSFQGNHIV